jgi:hypothetical protein
VLQAVGAAAILLGPGRARVGGEIVVGQQATR